MASRDLSRDYGGRLHASSWHLQAAVYTSAVSDIRLNHYPKVSLVRLKRRRENALDRMQRLASSRCFSKTELEFWELEDRKEVGYPRFCCGGRS